MGGFSPVPMDPLPQVEAPKEQPKPADVSQRGGFQGYPSEAGWTGKGGQALNVVSNFLSGWMAGKHMQEQKKQQAALTEVGHYQTDYQNSMMIYQNLVNNPDAKPEDKEKARQDVLRNWHELHQIQKKYLIGDESGGKDGQPKKKQGAGAKVKGALKGAFGAQEPHMFAAGAIDLADKMDPTQAVAPDLKQQETQFKLGEEKKDAKKREEYSNLLKNPNRTPDQQKQLEGIEDELYGPQAGLARLETKEAQRKISDLDAARNKYKQGGKLDDRERTLLESAGELPKTDVKTPFEAYMAEVGPGKKFATAAQAADAYFKKEVEVARASRNPSMVEEAYAAGRAVLKEQYEKEDADPKHPHTYRVTIGGKTEDRQLTDEQVAAAQKQDPNLKASKVPHKVDEGDVKKWAWEHMRPSPEEKEEAKPDKVQKPLTKAQANEILSPVLATVIQDNPDWERFVTRAGTATGGYSMYFKPYVSGEGSILPWKPSEATIRRSYESFKKEVENEMIRRGLGPYIPQLLPEESTAVQAMTPTPE